MPRKPIPTPRCAETPKGPRREITKHTIITPAPSKQADTPPPEEEAKQIIFLKPQNPIPGLPRGFHVKTGAILELNGLQRAHAAQLEVTLEHGTTVVLTDIGNTEEARPQPNYTHRPVHLYFCTEKHAETPQPPQIIIGGEVRAHALTIKGPVILIVTGKLRVDYLTIHDDSAQLRLQEGGDIQIKHKVHLPPHLQVEASSRAQFSAGEVVILGYSSLSAITSIDALMRYLNLMAKSLMATPQKPTPPF